MKKMLFAILVTFLGACGSDDEVTKDIISVSVINDIIVLYNVDFASIPFPDKVEVTYSDASTEALSITFSAGSYDKTAEGHYELTGTLSLGNGTTNKQNLKATVNIIVTSLLKSTSEDGNLAFEYFYDTHNRLDYMNIVASNTIYVYSYSSDNKVTQRIRKLAGKEYPEKYFYNTDGTLDRIEFYSAENVLSSTRTYTNANGKVAKYVNSDQSIAGLKFRAYEYNGTGNVSKVSFDIGNSWNYEYVNSKHFATPLRMDLADPQNLTTLPVSTFTYVQLSNYTSEYTYNTLNYPTEEVRTYPGNGDAQSTFSYTYY